MLPAPLNLAFVPHHFFLPPPPFPFTVTDPVGSSPHHLFTSAFSSLFQFHHVPIVPRALTDRRDNSIPPLYNNNNNLLIMTGRCRQVSTRSGRTSLPPKRSSTCRDFPKLVQKVPDRLLTVTLRLISPTSCRRKNELNKFQHGSGYTKRYSPPPLHPFTLSRSTKNCQDR